MLALLGIVYITASRNGAPGEAREARAFEGDKLSAMIEARVAYEVQQQLDRKMRLMGAGPSHTASTADQSAQTAHNFGEQKQSYKKPSRKMRVLVCPISV